MPIAILIPLIEGILGNVPADIAAFNALKDLLSGGKKSVSADELEQLRAGATAQHILTQGA